MVPVKLLPLRLTKDFSGGVIPQPTRSTDGIRRRVPELDAVRGIAILIVMVHNTLPKYPQLPLQKLFSYGWMGVDLFFVLSGFLITGILFDSKQATGYFRNFYARRCLRIWPLYYTVLLLMFVIIPFLRPSEASTVFARASPWWAYPLFLQNFLVHSPTGATGPLGTTWSLAIEEQFYVVWAVLVKWCSYRQLLRFAAAVILFSPILRFYLSLHEVYLYPNFFCRLDGLMAGSLLALMVRSSDFIPARFVNLAWASLFVAGPCALLTEAAHARWLTYSLSAAASAAFVYLSLFAAQPWFRLAIRNRALVSTGLISYGLYLLHKIPFDVAQSFGLDRYPWLTLVVGFAASYAMANASWNLLEKPFLNLKRVFGNARLSEASVL